MKAALPTLLWLSLTAGAFAADGPPVSPVAPQPRARLVQTFAGVAHQADASATIDSPAAVVMSKFVVNGSLLPGGVPQPVQPDPGNFSLLNGGRFFTAHLGSLPVEVGLWTPIDIMPETAKFRPQQTSAQFDFLRIKF